VTIHDWIRARTPPPPPRLRAGIDDALGRRGLRAVSEAPAETVDAAAAMLQELLARPTAGRESALGLLVVDALVTYAFEAAAAQPEQLIARANAAMARFSALA
jgi:hypothetical protein